MIFNFRLRQMGEIAPWENADGSHPHLGWFGLTDGYYWIEADSAELFRYSQPLVEKWTREHSGAPWLGALPYVDYQVARLWEDVLDILPEALDPVPAQLAQALNPDGPWTAWERAAKVAVEQALPYRETWDLLEAAAGWWWARRLDSAYLLAGPKFWFWNDGTNMSFQWDNRECILEGLPAWEAVLGRHTVPVADFIAETRSFDSRFISRMRDRVAIAQVEWARPEVALDPGLDQEQLVRSNWLAKSLDQEQRVRSNRLAQPREAIARQEPIHWDDVFCEAITRREPIRWDDVFRAIATIETLPGFAPEHVLRLS